MLKKIKVYGTLRKFLGQSEFDVDLNTPREAISFLVCNFKGIEEHMAEQFYTIQVGAKVITEDLLNLNTQDDIKIIPVVHGNFFQFCLVLVHCLVQVQSLLVLFWVVHCL